jgi:hypothetical protein
MDLFLLLEDLVAKIGIKKANTLTFMIFVVDYDERIHWSNMYSAFILLTFVVECIKRIRKQILFSPYYESC